MGGQHLLDVSGGNFAAGDVDLIAQSPAQEDLAIAKFREVAGLKDSRTPTEMSDSGQ